MVLSWTCLIFWSPLIKNWLFFLSILRYIFGSFFSDGSIISYSLGVKFGCLPTEFLLGWRVSLCVCVCNYCAWASQELLKVFYILREVHILMTLCTFHSPFPKCDNLKHCRLFTCLPLGAVVAIFSYSYHVLFLHMLRSCDFSFKHILSWSL